jgi:hypothetical protein
MEQQTIKQGSSIRFKNDNEQWVESPPLTRDFPVKGKFPRMHPGFFCFKSKVKGVMRICMVTSDNLIEY